MSKFYNRLALICGLLVMLLLSACSNGPAARPNPVYGFRPVRAEFNLGDEAQFKFKIIGVVSDGQTSLLFLYEKYELASGKKLGTFFKITSDGGATFGPERTVPEAAPQAIAFSLAGIIFVKDELAAVCVLPSGGRRNLFYMRSYTDGATWSEPVQINDEQDSVAGQCNFVQPSKDEVYCVWEDRRRGLPLIFFSGSRDGGRTWSPNQALEYDFREGEQILPGLATGAGGRLVAFWVDSRNRQTLKDVRFSYSDDGGLHWSPSQKINDDNEHVWQGGVAAIIRGNDIYAVFEDYRELGEEGDIDLNIYFTKSEDNGETWSKNIRLNDVQEGDDSYPFLAIDERGNLYCIWRSCRESIFGHIYFAHSTDGGRSWSRAIKVNEGNEMLLRRPLPPPIVYGGRLLCHWIEHQPPENQYHLAWLEPLPEQATDETPATKPERPAPISFSEGEPLFAADFSSGSDALWQAAAGTWTIVDGTYMGVEPGILAPFSSFARFKEPESYILRGRFKLDPVDHRMAYLYFRADPARDRYYVIGNSFRIGACLGLREGDTPPVHWGAFALHGRPLAERRFPFQNNRWYEFRLVVTPGRVDYYVDGRWMLGYEGKLKLPPGSIGVGGFDSAPTYFDDIAVYKIAK